MYFSIVCVYVRFIFIALFYDLYLYHRSTEYSYNLYRQVKRNTPTVVELFKRFTIRKKKKKNIYRSDNMYRWNAENVYRSNKKIYTSFVRQDRENLTIV